MESNKGFFRGSNVHLSPDHHRHLTGSRVAQSGLDSSRCCDWGLGSGNRTTWETSAETSVINGVMGHPMNGPNG